MRIPELTQILKVLACLTPFGAFSVLCEALLARSMRVKSLALRPLFSFTISTFFVAIPMAYGFGYWSLVAMLAAEMALGAAAFAFAARHLLVWPNFSTHAFRELWPMSLGFSISNPLEYVSRNADQFFVARLLGANALGLYSRASFAVKNSTSLFNDVTRIALFPAMAHVHEEKDRLRKALLKSLSLTAFLALPISALCIVFAPEIIKLLLGHQWLAAATPFALLTATLYPQLSRRSCFAIFQALGRPHWMITMQSLHAVLLIACVIWAASYGLTTVCAAVLVVWCAMAAVAMVAAARAVDIASRDILSVHARGVVLGGAIALGGWLLRTNVTFVESWIVFLFTLLVLMTCLVLFLPTSALGLRSVRHVIKVKLLLKTRLQTISYRQER